MRPQTVARTDAAVSLVDYLLSHNNDQEAAFLEVIGHICDRGDITRFCAERGIRIGMLIAWIRRDADRSRRYELALLDRRSLDAEAVRGKWSEVMESKPEAAPKWSDVLKASEMMGKYSGVLNDGPVGVERDAMSEGELREALKELLERNPDVKALVGAAGIAAAAGTIVDVEVDEGVRDGVSPEDAPMVVSGGDRTGVSGPSASASASAVETAETADAAAKPEATAPRREVSEQAKAARALKRPKAKAAPTPDYRISLPV